MLDENDKRKGEIMVAIRMGESDDDIRSNFNISTGTLKAIKSEYESIKKQLGEVKPVSEIAKSIQCSEEFIEEIKHFIETSEETLYEEAEANQEESKKETKPKGKGKGKPKDIDTSLKNTADSETAAVLVGDAGDVAKAVAIQRQEIGKFVMETMATTAMQYGYTSYTDWLQLLFDFFIQNNGRLNVLMAQLEEYKVANQSLLEELEKDIIGVIVNRRMDGIIALASERPNFDPEKLPQLLAQYKQVLASDRVFLKQLYDAIHAIPKNSGEVEVYAT